MLKKLISFALHQRAFVLGGVLKEMRGIMIMIPLLWPVLAMSIRDQLVRTQRPAAV